MEIIVKDQIEDTVIQSNYICDFRVNLPCVHHLWDVKY